MYSSNLSIPFMITILQVSIILYCGANLNDNIFSYVVNK